VAWKRRWGRGRVFYSAIGHAPEEWDIPEARALMQRGVSWASRGVVK
jgi:type 1 glutamine amidotransferase